MSSYQLRIHRDDNGQPLTITIDDVEYLRATYYFRDEAVWTGLLTPSNYDKVQKAAGNNVTILPPTMNVQTRKKYKFNRSLN